MHSSGLSFTAAPQCASVGVWRSEGSQRWIGTMTDTHFLIDLADVDVHGLLHEPYLISQPDRI